VTEVNRLVTSRRHVSSHMSHHMGSDDSDGNIV